jgi:Oxidoreductase molybdopterin binding domain
MPRGVEAMEIECGLLQRLRRSESAKDGVMRRVIVCGVLMSAVALGAAACPTDTEPRAKGILLTVQGAGVGPVAWDASDMTKLPMTSLTQRQVLTTNTGAASAGSERSVIYEGVLLRDVLARAGFGTANDRGARVGVIEAVATDGYRSVFSWGELFNSNAGEQVLVISTMDGRPLDATAGPLALRALADIRPGPRHVRNLCALVVRR